MKIRNKFMNMILFVFFLNGEFIIANDVRTVELINNDIIYSTFSQKIYATVSSTDGPMGNHLVVIDPVEGIIDTSIYVGSEPNKLAISNNGQYIYISLDGAAAIRRVDLATLTAGIQFSLGIHDFYGPYYVSDMDVMPGNPSIISVSRKFSHSTAFGGVTIYENGIERPTATWYGGSNVIDFSDDSSVLYGYNNSDSGFEFNVMEVSDSGVVLISQTDDLISGYNKDIEYADGKVFSTDGGIIDPDSLVLIGQISHFVHAMTFDVENEKAFYMDVSHSSGYFYSTIRSYNISSFEYLDNVVIDSIFFSIRKKLIRWGNNGLAFANYNNIYLVRNSIVSLNVHESEILENFQLFQNYPNPFNPTTKLSYDLPEEAQVKIMIYDLMGREVRTLVNDQQSAGFKSIVWDATNNLNQPVSAGMYLYQISAGKFHQVKKMVLLK